MSKITYIKKGQVSFSRHILSIWQESNDHHPFFLFFFELLKCQWEKSSAQSPEASLSTGGLSSQIFLRTYPFSPPAREIPPGFGSPLANANWKRDPPVGDGKKKKQMAELAVTPPAARPRRQQDPAGDFYTEGEWNLRDTPPPKKKCPHCPPIKPTAPPTSVVIKAELLV